MKTLENKMNRIMKIVEKQHETKAANEFKYDYNFISNLQELKNEIEKRTMFRLGAAAINDEVTKALWNNCEEIQVKKIRLIITRLFEDKKLILMPDDLETLVDFHG